MTPRRRHLHTVIVTGFSDIARWTSRWLGHPISFSLAILCGLVWLVLGPVFDFSDTWQLVMATGSSAITFFMVFLLQSSQNRESQAMQVKLDELIRAVEGARNELVSAERMTIEELEHLSRRYAALADTAREAMKRGVVESGTPDLLSLDDELEDEKSSGPT